MPDAVIRIGTAGFSYPDWKGTFYPAGVPKARFLEHYATVFDTLELNATFYALPSLATLAGLAARTPPGFSFAVKAHRAITHEPAGAEGILPAFRMSLRPFEDAGKLGAVLLQFPYAFQPVEANRTRLASVADALAGLPLVVEFRHRAWYRDEMLAWVRERGLNLCCVDEPDLPGLLPPDARLTGGIGYVRLHGRNAEAWWAKDRGPSERYRYRYETPVLREWAGKVGGLARSADRIYVFFNNHPGGHAAANAVEFRDLLRAADQA